MQTALVCTVSDIRSQALTYWSGDVCGAVDTAFCINGELATKNIGCCCETPRHRCICWAHQQLRPFRLKWNAAPGFEVGMVWLNGAGCVCDCGAATALINLRCLHGDVEAWRLRVSHAEGNFNHKPWQNTWEVYNNKEQGQWHQLV